MEGSLFWGTQTSVFSKPGEEDCNNNGGERVGWTCCLAVLFWMEVIWGWEGLRDIGLTGEAAVEVTADYILSLSIALTLSCV